ncbi:DUF2779 domain-containing protein [Candidatus Spongiihabitans sp.]|uniref:DUF2779 domain-containing protein n=1 Tax=Candidatus Spongiihabitans sp. TaxID=3101308 RepID=UPI003C7CEA11
MNKRLSKSKIMSGLQCEKRLWLEVHQPDAKIVSDNTQWLFDSGNAVNDVARALHQGGHLIELVDWNFADAIEETKRRLNDAPQAPLFEGTFVHDGVLIMADILQRDEDGYRLIEVKSSSSVKDPYYADCAVQAWVLEGAGLTIHKVELAHINTSFIYRGAGDYHGLLHYENLTDAIAEHKREVPNHVSRFKKVLAGEQPNIEVGDHCHTPYTCPFIEHCSAPNAGESVKYPVTCLPHDRGISAQLLSEGIEDLRDIPHDRLHNEQHKMMRRVCLTGKAELNPRAKKFINRQPYPRYYFDFETIGFAVPIWKGTRPYQQIPFQWSCHMEEQSGELRHAEFLDTTGDAPMRAVTESLLQAVGDSGPIFVYGAFEKGRLNDLAGCFVDLADDIEKVIERLVNLLPLARFNYYHPDMMGSWSLKNVLPTVAPHLDYSDLGEVRDGAAAGAAFRQITHPETDAQHAKSLTHDLLEYCKRDTEGLVALVRFLASGKIQTQSKSDA